MPSFYHGFKALADQLGDAAVGAPLEDETYVTPNYSLQFTEQGVMVYSGVANKPQFFSGGPLAEGEPVTDARPWAVIVHADNRSYCTAGGTHGGWPAVDAFAPVGTPIYAPEGGQSRPQSLPLGGHTTILTGDSGLTWYFAHGHVPFKGGRVERGQQIGQVGNSGNARFTAAHVHFAAATDGNIDRGHSGGSGNVEFDPWIWGQ